jgi:hypothetical protein
MNADKEKIQFYLAWISTETKVEQNHTELKKNEDWIH